MGRLYIVSGPSAVGKDTVFQHLRERMTVGKVVTVTTRDPRPGEVHGVHYYFTDIETFRARIAEGAFAEYNCYTGKYYGTLKEEINRLLGEYAHVIAVLDVNGATNIKACYPDAVTVFIEPPTVEDLKRRIVARGAETQEQIDKRLAVALEELARKGEFDHCLVNDVAENCADKLAAILTQ